MSADRHVGPLVAAIVLTHLVVQARPAHAAFQGRNGRIAFVECTSTCAGLCNLKTVDPDGSDPRTLVGGREPAWSPDGSQLAYTSSGSVYVINADGSGNRLVPGGGREPAWSPDGKALVLVVGDELWVQDLATNARRRLTVAEQGPWVPGVPFPTTTSDHHSSPVWQPTGDFIVFARARSVAFDAYGGYEYLDLWAVQADGSGLRQLTEPGFIEQQQNDPGIEDQPDFSPDGAAVVYRRAAAWPHEQQVYRVPAGGGEPTQLTQASHEQGQWPPYPSWSPDGRRIAYLTRLFVNGTHAWELRVMTADGREITPVLRTGNTICGTDWQVIPGKGLVVNSSGQLPDATPGDGRCDTGKTIAGGDPECTLRAAIAEANWAPDRDEITFAIPGTPPFYIHRSSEYAFEITQPAMIDGTTQPGTEGVVLFGVSKFAQDRVNGLTIRAGPTTVRGLTIIDFSGWGIALLGGAGHVIEGNYIGVTPDGFEGAGNGTVDYYGDRVYGGILVQSTDTRIGGTDHDEGVCNRACNVIAGNGPDDPVSGTPGAGIEIGGEATGTQVWGNFIGTDVSGMRDPSRNDGDEQPQLLGIRVGQGAADTVIGGNSQGRRNLIAANAAAGIVVEDGALRTVVQGNWIGLDATGRAVPGTQQGTGVELAADAFVENNVVAGHRDRGIGIAGPNATGVVVTENRIGTSADGSTALPNRIGIEIGDGAANPLVSANTIAFAPQAGLRMTFGATGGFVILNTVTANGIGVEAIGARGGKLLQNTIRANGVGVAVTEDGTLELERTAIWDSTAGLGIDLGPAGVTPNDLGDVDAGPNDLLNFPVPHFAILEGGGLRVGGVYDGSLGSRTYRLELFASDACNLARHGEGQRPLGTASVTTDFAGRAVIDTTVTTAAAAAGDWITATATDSGGRTSEFSRCVEARPGTGLTEPAARGASVLQVASTAAFHAGDTIVVCPGCDTEEQAVVAALGSLRLAAPLAFDHLAGEPVANLSPPPTTTTTTSTTSTTTSPPTTTTPASTTTSTTAPRCMRAPTLESIRCRLALLHAAVDAVNPAKVEKALLARLRMAAARTDDAAAATPGKRRGKLRAAGRAVQAFQQRLRTKPVRRALDDAVRAAWSVEARELASDLRAVLTDR